MKEETKETKIRYRNLSVPLKLAIIAAWVMGVIYGLLVLIGFMEGLMGV